MSEKTIAQLAGMALEYHKNNPRPWEGPGFRPVQITIALPLQEYIRDQYDCGDCGGRSLDSWMYLRQITGDMHMGEEVEQEVFSFTDDLLNNRRGLSCVPDLRTEEQGDYYQMWDQGRMFRYLVHGYEVSRGEKRDYFSRRIDGMIEGFKGIAQYGSFEPLGECMWFDSDEYNDAGSIYREELGMCLPRAGQLIEPMARYAAITKRQDIRDLALALANGYLSEYEVGSRHKEFDSPYISQSEGSLATKGVFLGHTHGNLAALVGLAVLGEVLEDKQQAKAYLDAAIRGWRWVTDEENNPNPGTFFGWIPEVMTRKTFWSMSEFCCTADWIQLNAQLGRCAIKHPEYQSQLGIAWDYQEAAFRNIVSHVMFSMDAEELARMETLQQRFLPGSPSEGQEENSHVLPLEERKAFWKKLRGGVASSISPVDMAYEASANHIASHVHSMDPHCTCEHDGPLIAPGGCCCFSTGRALGTVWNSAVIEMGENIYVCQHLEADHPALTLSTPQAGHLDIRKKDDRTVLVHLPGWIEADSCRVVRNDAEHVQAQVDNLGWLRIEAGQAGDTLTLTYELKSYATHHAIGFPPGKDIDRRAPLEERETYTFHWKGGTIVDAQPAGVYFPLLRSK